MKIQQKFKWVAFEPSGSHNFQPDFEVLLGIQIELMIARWKALDVDYPTQVEFPNLELI